MSANEMDPRVAEFLDRLTGRARKLLNHTGIVTHADLIKALNHGHPAKAIADACNKDLPSSDRHAWPVLQTRIAWYATHTPSEQPRPAQPAKHDCSQHPDGHVCPWVNTDNGVQRCPCSTGATA